MLVFENPQGSNRSTIDPRVVAVFEHFGFRCLACAWTVFGHFRRPAP